MTAGMAIHDTMQYIKPRVSTVCMGQAASMGSFLLAAGEPGMRIALPNARFMVHQPSGGARGMASDIEIQAREILRIKKRMNDLYVKYTGQSLDDIEKAMDRDTFLEADEAMVADAQTVLSDAGADSVIMNAGPLEAGVAEHGPYDVITIQGGVEEVPVAIIHQLKEGGRIAALFMTGALGEVRIGRKIDGQMNWRLAFNASAPVLPGFSKARDFAL